MRIAYLTQSYPPMISGAAILVERLAKSMARRGHQVLVIAASDKAYPYRSYQENLTVVRLRSVHNPLRVGQRFLVYPRADYPSWLFAPPLSQKWCMMESMDFWQNQGTSTDWQTGF